MQQAKKGGEKALLLYHLQEEKNKSRTEKKVLGFTSNEDLDLL